MQCRHCGLDNSSEAVFCASCGADLSDGNSEKDGRVSTDTAPASGTAPKKSEKSSKLVIMLVMFFGVIVLISGIIIAGLIYAGTKKEADTDIPALPLTDAVDIRAVSDGRYLAEGCSFWAAGTDGGGYSIYNGSDPIGTLSVSTDVFQNHLITPDRSGLMLFADDNTYLITADGIRALGFTAPVKIAVSSDGMVNFHTDAEGNLYRCNASDGTLTLIDGNASNELPLISSPNGSAIIFHKNVNGVPTVYLWDGKKTTESVKGMCGISVSDDCRYVYATDFKNVFSIGADGTAVQLNNMSNGFKTLAANRDASQLLVADEKNIHILEDGTSPSYLFEAGSGLSEILPSHAVSSKGSLRERVYSTQSGVYYISEALNVYDLCDGNAKSMSLSHDGREFCHVNSSGQLISTALGDEISYGTVLVDGGVSKAEFSPDGAIWYLNEASELHFIKNGSDTLTAENVCSFGISGDGTVLFDTLNNSARSGELWCVNSISSPVLADSSVDKYFCRSNYSCYIKNLNSDGSCDIYVASQGNSFAECSKNSKFIPLS